MTKPTERRDFLVGNAVRAAKSTGQTVDADAIARQAARDLSVVDRMKADGTIRQSSSKKTKTKDKARAETAKREQVVSDLAQQKQAKFYERAIDAKAHERPLPKLYGVDALRLAAMHKRVEMICRPVPGYRLKPAEPIGNQCQYPALANAVLMHTACFARCLAGYKELSYEDRQRRYQRAIEDICDRSTALLGPWWVK